MAIFTSRRILKTRISGFALAAALLSAPLAYAEINGPVNEQSEPNSSRMPTPGSMKIDVETVYREALEALSEADYRTAEKKLAQVLKVAPKDAQANYFMALAKIGQGKQKSSVRYLERAINERPDYIEARETLGLVSIELGRTDDARDQLDALKEIESGCQSNGCEGVDQARLAEAAAKLEAALASGNQSSSLDLGAYLAAMPAAASDDGVGRYLAAERLLNEERYEEAISDLYASKAVIGPHPNILNYLGYAHRKLGRFDKAQTYYAAALRIDPGHLGANEYLGELYLELGDIKRAKKQLASLDRLCAFGCAQREDLARLIDVKESLRSAARQ